MEIALLNPGSIKIKSKLANFVVDPLSNSPKTDADVIISLGSEVNSSKITDFRLIIQGPGEYEVKGVKVSGEKANLGGIFKLTLDKLNVVLAKASDLSKADKAGEANVVVINADDAVSDKAITTMAPNVVVFYGEKAVEAAKALKENSADAVSKYAVTFDKLPQEMEVVVLG